VWLPGRKYVVQAIEARMEVHPSGEIFKLPCYCPWKSHLYELETELDIQTPLKYCLYEVRCMRLLLVPTHTWVAEGRYCAHRVSESLRLAAVDGVSRAY
jgi:uncharacterized UPF0160 family protein